MVDYGRRFREAHDYALVHGFATGFPNFHEADYGDGVVQGTHLLRDDVVEFRDVPRTEYGLTDLTDVPAVMRAATDFAAREGYGAAIPDFHQGDHGAGVVWGTFLVKAGKADWRDVPRDELGVYHIEDVPGMMRAANDYAVANGFAAGIPTFHQADHGAGVVCGVVLFHPSTATWRDIPADLLRGYSDAWQSWAVVLCRPSDVAVPNSARDRYLAFFTEGGGDPSNAVGYWRDLSYGLCDGAGSEVFGVFNIGKTGLEIDAFSGQVQRQKIAEWGMDTARRNNVQLDRFSRHVIVLTRNADHGAVGEGAGSVIVFAYAEGRALEPTFMHHEMGHGIGFPHSSSEGEGTYGDWFDIMSAMSVATFNDTAGRAAGPGMAAPNLEREGWLHRSRVYRTPIWQLESARIQLVALDRPDIDGYLAARMGMFLVGQTHWVEYRQPTGWDRGIGTPIVLIHTRNAAGGSELVGSRTDRRGRLGVGQEFVTPGPLPWVIHVEAIDVASSTATIRMWPLGSGTSRDVRIVTIMFDPAGSEPQGEWVLIRNDRSTASVLTGWTLEDQAGHRFVFPATTLQPGADIKLWTGTGTEDQDNRFWGRRAAVWNNTGDIATLRDASGAARSEYRYGKP